jgi:hypothetical protein
VVLPSFCYEQDGSDGGLSRLRMDVCLGRNFIDEALNRGRAISTPLQSRVIGTLVGQRGEILARNDARHSILLYW